MQYIRQTISIVCLFLSITMWAQGAELLKLDLPLPHQVIQRTGVAPGAGFAEVSIRGTMPPGAIVMWRKRRRR